MGTHYRKTGELSEWINLGDCGDEVQVLVGYEYDTDLITGRRDDYRSLSLTHVTPVTMKFSDGEGKVDIDLLPFLIQSAKDYLTEACMEAERDDQVAAAEAKWDSDRESRWMAEAI